MVRRHRRCFAGLTFEDDAKASAVAALDLDWIVEEVAWVGRQLWPADELKGRGQAAGGTSGNVHGLAR